MHHDSPTPHTPHSDPTSPALQRTRELGVSGRMHAPIRRNYASGMTLLELTVVILVLLSLIGLLFAGSRAWKAAADRSACIMHQSNVQKALRGHVNLHQSYIGDTITNLPDQLIGPGRYLATYPECPAMGTYTFGAIHGRDVVPPLGTIYMSCSLAASNDHEPRIYDDW